MMLTGMLAKKSLCKFRRWRIILQATLITAAVTGICVLLGHIAPRLLAGKSEISSNGCSLDFILPDKRGNLRKRISDKFNFLDSLKFGSGMDVGGCRPFEPQLQVTPPDSARDHYSTIATSVIAKKNFAVPALMPVPVLSFSFRTAVVDGTGKTLPLNIPLPQKYLPPPQNTLLRLHGDFPYCWLEIIQSCGDRDLDNYLLRQLAVLKLERGTYCVRWGRP